MVRLTAPSYANTFTLTPRPSAAAMIRKAVVDAADSYGASMIATVSVRSAMTFVLLVPDGLGSGLGQEIHQRVDRRLAYPRWHVARLDAPLAERAIVDEHLDAAGGGRAERRAAGAGARGEHGVLHEEDRDRPAALAQGGCVVGHESARRRRDRVAGFDEDVPWF